MWKRVFSLSLETVVCFFLVVLVVGVWKFNFFIVWIRGLGRVVGGECFII